MTDILAIAAGAVVYLALGVYAWKVGKREATSSPFWRWFFDLAALPACNILALASWPIWGAFIFARCHDRRGRIGAKDYWNV